MMTERSRNDNRDETEQGQRGGRTTTVRSQNDNRRGGRRGRTSIEVHLLWNSPIHGKCAYPSGLKWVFPW